MHSLKKDLKLEYATIGADRTSVYGETQLSVNLPRSLVKLLLFFTCNSRSRTRLE